jgi:hypothetical protein
VSWRTPVLQQPSPSRVAARHLDLTIEDYGVLNYWGNTGIGVGSKAPPKVIEKLRALGRKVKPRKHKVLWRGLSLKPGTIRHSGYEGLGSKVKSWSKNPTDYNEVAAPDGWERYSSGWYLADVSQYLPMIRGVRSWTPKVRDAEYYMRGGRPANYPYGFVPADWLLVKWLNPSGIIVDTKPVKDSGYEVWTDTGEVIADASDARIVSIDVDGGRVVLTIEG